MKFFLVLSLLSLAACGQAGVSESCHNTSPVQSGTQTSPSCTCVANGQVAVFPTACPGGAG